MNFYELLILTKVDVDEEWVERLREGVKREGKATAGNFKRLARKNLAYPIAHTKEGYYYVLQFQCLPEYIQKIRDFLRYSEGILRFMIKRKDTISERLQ